MEAQTNPRSKPVTVKAEPYDIQINPEKTAVLVIDMQNDFCSEGGFVTLMGGSVKLTREPIKYIQDILKASRARGCRIVYTRTGYRPDLSNIPKIKLDRIVKFGVAIGSRGPRGRVLVRGTWNTEIIEELKPSLEDTIVDKNGFNAFYQTDLELILRNTGIETLVFTGVNTNACVVSTLQSAYDRGYICLSISNACASQNGRKAHEAALVNIKTVYGFVTTSDEFVGALRKNDSPGRGSAMTNVS